MSYLRPAIVALLMVAVLLCPAASLLPDGDPTARAYPGLTVALDVDPLTTTDANGNGLYEEGVEVSTFESCIGVSSGTQLDVLVSVLDVTDLAAFQADFRYNGSVVRIVGSYTGTTPSNTPTMFLSEQSGSTVLNLSDGSPVEATGVLVEPDSNGFYTAAAVDWSLEPPDGDDGSGALARLTLEAVASGASPLNFDISDVTGRARG